MIVGPSCKDKGWHANYSGLQIARQVLPAGKILVRGSEPDLTDGEPAMNS